MGKKILNRIYNCYLKDKEFNKVKKFIKPDKIVINNLDISGNAFSHIIKILSNDDNIYNTTIKTISKINYEKNNYENDISNEYGYFNNNKSFDKTKYPFT